MRVLFVCLGNICRSPLAHGIFEHVAAERGLDIEVGSAGTSHWHIGEPPDYRSIAVAARHGIDLTPQRARQFCAADFERFDLIIGMDRSNLMKMERLRGGPGGTQPHLLLEYALGEDRDVPDPYCGEMDAFEACYRIIRAGAEALGTRLASGIDNPPRS
ncbi:MAG: low molecular weight protein-tyrosine-phosphatase [Pseudomonadota bacterium]